MIDLQTEVVDLPALLTSPECQERNCCRSYVARFKDEPHWRVYHANGERFALVAVPFEMIEDQPMMMSLVPQFHEIMDSLGEKPA